jgi:hypothetical protein
MRLVKEELNLITLEPENSLNLSEYLASPGEQHYKLLAWLSTQFNDKEIFDIGTHMGASASALSYNKSNKVISFDISHDRLVCKKSNCEYFLQNLWDASIRDTWKDRILNSPLIFLDIDPHEGNMEFEFYTWLKSNNYNGILVLDDIWYFKGMRDNLWYHISDNKFDITSLGHWSGTGIVDFSNTVEYTKPDTSNWTLITAYFDLTKEPDASIEIKNRPSLHYLSTANSTMSVEQNLVVFCDETTKPLLENLRPKHLTSKTKFIIMKFSDFEIVNSRDKIIQNRKEKLYHFDNRNTASYYLFCMTRYVMINKIIEENPFQSTHFAWINVCIERMGWKNVMSLNDALSVNRDKFSTCYIDYQPKELVENYQEYFKFGRCGMCSGFFTGNIEYFKKFNDLILETFYECLEKGYGHADEQLFSIVYFRHPEIFEHYFGDYHQMITNYISVVDYIEGPVIHIIKNSFINKDYSICLKACNSVLNNAHKLPDNIKPMFFSIYNWLIKPEAEDLSKYEAPFKRVDKNCTYSP